MADNTKVADIYEASSKLAKYPFEPYWPEKKLRICVTGAGGFIARCVRNITDNRVGRRPREEAARRCSCLHGRCAYLGHRLVLPRCCSHLAKRLKSEGHYIVGCGEPWARCADRTFRRCSFALALPFRNHSFAFNINFVQTGSATSTCR